MGWRHNNATVGYADRVVVQVVWVLVARFVACLAPFLKEAGPFGVAVPEQQHVTQ